MKANSKPNGQIKQFRLATFAHDAVRRNNNESRAADEIKQKIEDEGLTDSVRITSAQINGQKHTVVAVPAQYTDLPPSTGDVAVVPKVKSKVGNTAGDNHVAVVTAEDAHKI